LLFSGCKAEIISTKELPGIEAEQLSKLSKQSVIDIIKFEFSTNTDRKDWSIHENDIKYVKHAKCWHGYFKITDRGFTYQFYLYEENGKVLENFYRENGGILHVICKSMCGHHPHGLDDPMIIVDFVEANYPEEQ
jgi:hypothetical protein